MKPCSAMALVSSMPGAFFSVFSACETASFLVAQPEPKAIMPMSTVASRFSWHLVFIVVVFMLCGFSSWACYNLPSRACLRRDNSWAHRKRWRCPKSRRKPIGGWVSSSINFWHYIGIRAEKPLSVEMNQMLRVFGNPHFGFPGNLREKTPHDFSRGKRGDKNKASFATSEQLLQFLPPLSVNRASTRNGFNQ